MTQPLQLKTSKGEFNIYLQQDVLEYTIVGVNVLCHITLLSS